MRGNAVGFRATTSRRVLVSVLTTAALVGTATSTAASGGAPRSSVPKPQTLRPNLVPLPTSRVVLDDTGPYLNSLSQPSFAVGGCRIDEMVEQGARRCLRFDTAVANFGTGPVEVRYRTSADVDAALVQRIYRSDDSYLDRVAAPSDFHPIHAHFHYRNFSISRLWRADSRGRKIGRSPVVTGQKNGFCFEDTQRVRGDGRGRYNCLDYDEEGPDRVTGISVGFADVYTYILNGQYLEVSGVPDGRYLLETTIDPDRTLLETTRRDNSVRVLIEICGNSAAFIQPRQEACA